VDLTCSKVFWKDKSVQNGHCEPPKPLAPPTRERLWLWPRIGKRNGSGLRTELGNGHRGEGDRGESRYGIRRVGEQGSSIGEGGAELRELYQR
jgi:hypothetical protein